MGILGCFPLRPQYIFYSTRAMQGCLLCKLSFVQIADVFLSLSLSHRNKAINHIGRCVCSPSDGITHCMAWSRPDTT